MMTDTVPIKFQLGRVEGPGNFTGLTCELSCTFDKDKGQFVLTGDGFTGHGDTVVGAAIDWVADRVGEKT